MVYCEVEFAHKGDYKRKLMGIRGLRVPTEAEAQEWLKSYAQAIGTPVSWVRKISKEEAKRYYGERDLSKWPIFGKDTEGGGYMPFVTAPD